MKQAELTRQIEDKCKPVFIFLSVVVLVTKSLCLTHAGCAFIFPPMNFFLFLFFLSEMLNLPENYSSAK